MMNLIHKWIKKKSTIKQGIGIAEKSQETRRDRWGGHVTTNPYFDSVIRENLNAGKIGICGYMATPAIWPQRSLFLV